MRNLPILLLLAAIITAPCAAAVSPNPTLAIGVFSDRTVHACTITSQAPITLTDEGGRQVAEIPGGAVLEIENGDGMVTASCDSPKGSGRSPSYVLSSASPLQVRPDSGKPRSYRGQLALSARAARLLIVDRTTPEDYLRGVLPSEIPASFAPEALRAQAIAARTYAMIAAGRHHADGYDLCDLSHCQVYLGVDGENRRTNAAVSDTAGLIVTYQHKPIDAVYHDACGGRTAGNETAWQGSNPLPYLRPVLDSDPAGAFCGLSPRAVWTRQISQAKLASALVRLGVTAPISTIEAGACDPNGRPQEYVIGSSQGEVKIKAGVLRDTVNRALGATTLPSADFTAAPNGDSFVFAGRGSGHGVGLCQWGANAMAKAGHTAAQILAHYYQATAVEPVSAEIAARLYHPGSS